MRALAVVSFGPVASLTVLSVLAATACTRGEVQYAAGGTTSTSSGGAGASGQGGAGGSGTGGTYAGITIVQPDASSLGGAGGTGSSPPPPTWPPTGFVNVTNVTYGAYATDPNQISSAGGASGQGGSSGGSSGSSQCAGLFGVVRDFKMGNLSGGHPDFQVPTPRNAAETGIVTDTLGDDGKPVYANPPAGGTTSTQANFDQWYRDVDGVNIPFVVGLHFIANPSGGNGVVTFAASLGTSTGTGRNRDAGAPAVATSSYFPVDGLGWNDTARADDGNQHNFAFTTEIHTAFIYNLSGGRRRLGLHQQEAGHRSWWNSPAVAGNRGPRCPGIDSRNQHGEFLRLGRLQCGTTYDPIQFPHRYDIGLHGLRADPHHDLLVPPGGYRG